MFHLGTDTRFAPQNLFTLVFAGSEHRVSFDRQDSNAVLRRVAGANGSRRVYLDTPIHTVALAEDSIFYGDSSIEFLVPNLHTARFMGSLENLREIHNGNVYIDGNLVLTQQTSSIGNDTTIIVNGNVRVHRDLRLSNPTSRLSIRGNLHNGVDAGVASSISASANGALLDLQGDYI